MLEKIENNEVFIDECDLEIFRKYKWKIQYQKNTRYIYCSTYDGIKVKCILFHRLILNCSHGDKKCVDHIDGNGLNNLRDNLRICTHSENMRNRINNKPHSSIYKGVSWTKLNKKWRASIRINKKYISLGLFINEVDAAKAYNIASEKYHKDFSRINNLVA